MAFQKLNIDLLSRFPGSGVCDVCNKPISPGEAYMIDNYTFYHSPEYRNYIKNSPMALMMGHYGMMNDAYFDAQYARDTSTGSAICPNCIHMFAEKKAAPTPKPAPPKPAPKPAAPAQTTAPSANESKKQKQGFFSKLKNKFKK